MNFREKLSAYLQEKGKKLLCSDFKDTIIVQHQDGSFFHLHNAIIEEREFDKFDMIFVWTEHCGYFYFFKGDLENWGKYKRV